MHKIIPNACLCTQGSTTASSQRTPRRWRCPPVLGPGQARCSRTLQQSCNQSKNALSRLSCGIGFPGKYLTGCQSDVQHYMETLRATLPVPAFPCLLLPYSSSAAQPSLPLRCAASRENCKGSFEGHGVLDLPVWRRIQVRYPGKFLLWLFRPGAACAQEMSGQVAAATSWDSVSGTLSVVLPDAFFVRLLARGSRPGPPNRQQQYCTPSLSAPNCFNSSRQAHIWA